LIVAFIGATAGALLGVISAYLGGKIDLFMQRIMDVVLAFPLLILALAIVSILGRSIPNVVLAIAIPIIPRTTRIRQRSVGQRKHVCGSGPCAWGLAPAGHAATYRP
jgi:peptide/nickel transport system permease protein